MIAPLRQSDPEITEIRRRLRQARKIVAQTLLGSRDAAEAPSVASWRAWTFTAWVLAVTGAYCAYLFGLI